jgi:hypothetical protein
MKQSIMTDEHPSLVMHVSGDGVDFFIVKNGTLHFDYFRSWQSIQGSETAIQKNLFISTIVTETQKVSNFVMSRFKEKLARVYLITPAFQPEIVEALNGQLGITPVPLSIPATKLAAAWYVPLGASLREFNNPSFDGVNLNNASASDIFFEEHSLSFLLFWRRLTVLVGIFFLATFLIAYSFLGEQLAGLRVQLENSRSQTNARELSELKEKYKNALSQLTEAEAQRDALLAVQEAYVPRDTPIR